MKKKFALIVAVFTLTLSAAPDAWGQWVHVSPPNSNQSYRFVSSGAKLFVETGTSVFLSKDSGESWDSVYSTPIPLVAIDSTLIGLTEGSVLRSTDDGMSWNSYPDNLPQMTLITCQTADGSNLFVGTNGSGIFFSSDSGISWSSRNTGMTGPYTSYITMIAVNGSDLYVGTLHDLFLSTDTGKSWVPVDSGFVTKDTSLNIDAFAFGASDSNLFVMTNWRGLFRSTKQGASWIQASNSNLLNQYMDAFAMSGGNLFAGSQPDQGGFPTGVFLSSDNGANWIEVNSGLMDTADVAGLMVFGPYLYAATNGGVWRRPLPDFGISAVSPVASTENSLTSYPNPFTQSTTISFTTPESGVADVSVVNILGATVAHIFSGELDAGTHSFTWDANGLPAGVYECIVQQNGKVERTAMVVN